MSTIFSVSVFRVRRQSRGRLPDLGSFLGGEIELVAWFDAEEIIPVVCVDHDTVETLAEQGVVIFFFWSSRISSTLEGMIGCPLATPVIAASLYTVLPSVSMPPPW